MRFQQHVLQNGAQAHGTRVFALQCAAGKSPLKRISDDNPKLSFPSRNSARVTGWVQRVLPARSGSEINRRASAKTPSSVAITGRRPNELGNQTKADQIVRLDTLEGLTDFLAHVLAAQLCRMKPMPLFRNDHG